MRYPSDEFTPEMARPKVRKYIRGQFDWVARKYRSESVVEKTCANSLRVGFVDQVLPDAKYIFIRRNGFDAIGSIIKRWKASVDLAYLARKARFVPLSDLPYYAGRYFYNRAYKLLSTEKSLAFWGPRFDAMQELARKYSLEELCALQWKKCVDRALDVLEKMPQHRFIKVEYEDFVHDPEEQLGHLSDWLGISLGPKALKHAVADVSAHSVGKGYRQLDDSLIDRLSPLIRDTQKRCGYE